MAGKLPTELIPVLHDNYAYRLTYAPNSIAVVDPPVVQPFLDGLSGRVITHILVTHHHPDHTAGILELKKKTGARVIGPNDPRVPGVDQVACPGDRIELGEHYLSVMDFKGHTQSLIGYANASGKQLWCGDLIFGAGCGRMFEGTAEEFLASIDQLEELSSDWAIFCGHEYTEHNLKFAQTVEPHNSRITQRLELVAELRKMGEPTVPLNLGEERATNPFLRCHAPDAKFIVECDHRNPVSLFAALRLARDQF